MTCPSPSTLTRLRQIIDLIDGRSLRCPVCGVESAKGTGPYVEGTVAAWCTVCGAYAHWSCMVVTSAVDARVCSNCAGGPLAE